MALFGLLSLLLRLFEKNGQDKSKLLRSLLLWGVIFVTMYAFFSVAGFFHRYYLSSFSPAVAALSGIGLMQLWHFYSNPDAEASRASRMRVFLLPLALTATAAVQIVILTYSMQWLPLFGSLICFLSGGAAISLTVLALNKHTSHRAAGRLCAVGLAGLLAAPAFWSVTPILYGVGTVLPVAGPTDSESRGIGSFSSGISQSDTALADFLLSHDDGQTYLLATANATTAAPVILATGRAVMAIGGFKGSDPAISLEEFIALVRGGQVKYFLLGGMSLSKRDRKLGAAKRQSCFLWQYHRKFG